MPYDIIYRHPQIPISGRGILVNLFVILQGKIFLHVISFKFRFRVCHPLSFDADCFFFCFPEPLSFNLSLSIHADKVAQSLHAPINFFLFIVVRKVFFDLIFRVAGWTARCFFGASFRPVGNDLTELSSERRVVCFPRLTESSIKSVPIYVRIETKSIVMMRAHVNGCGKVEKCS
jgi:hypothetical protein